MSRSTRPCSDRDLGDQPVEFDDRNLGAFGKIDRVGADTNFGARLRPSAQCHPGRDRVIDGCRRPLRFIRGAVLNLPRGEADPTDAARRRQMSVPSAKGWPGSAEANFTGVVLLASSGVALIATKIAANRPLAKFDRIASPSSMLLRANLADKLQFRALIGQIHYDFTWEVL